MPLHAGWNLENTYRQLNPYFYAATLPTPVSQPRFIILNHPLATRLGLNPESLLSEEGLQIFSGNKLPPGSQPIAQAYAGHQFGYFSMLGDGRAILLGEQVCPDSVRYDIQLKGSGRTPYSRQGDGRAALGPMLREYLISEAMTALEIPTSRSLAVISTGDPVYREKPLSGAILTRVAFSHIRIGTFEYVARFHGNTATQQLADYAIQRHDPDCAIAANPYAEFLKRVIDRQAQLVSQWMLIGFVHGVMNTDNMLISGETIDYGPCAFMDRYDPATVFSTIDHQGRYAYGNQPSIAHWNLTRFAETLLPILSHHEREAVEIAKQCLDHFSDAFDQYWSHGIAQKLGLRDANPGLVHDLFSLMKSYRLDYTLTFRALSLGKMPQPAPALSSSEFQEHFLQWKSRWELACGGTPETIRESQQRMRRTNPQVIPRNHRVEAAINAFVENQNPGPFHDLLQSVTHPFGDYPEDHPDLSPAPDDAPAYRTFCGT